MIDQFLAELHNIDVETSLIGSLIAGALIGSEREVRGRAAGLRTHTLVCFTAALMTLLGLRMEDWATQLPVGTQLVSDMSRMPHGILTGVGFLGAGVIFRDGVNVQGLTTAATLWLTAALGIVFGTGLIGLATLGTLIALIVLVLLRLIQRWRASPPEWELEIALPLDSAWGESALRDVLRSEGFTAGPMRLTRDLRANERRYAMRLVPQAGASGAEQLVRALEGAQPVMLAVTPDP